MFIDSKFAYFFTIFKHFQLNLFIFIFMKFVISGDNIQPLKIKFVILTLKCLMIFIKKKTLLLILYNTSLKRN